MNKFRKFLYLKEEKSEDVKVTSRIKLQNKDGSKEFTPFVINQKTHSNLRPLVKAFLASTEVGVGYTTLDKSKGEIEPSLKKKTLYLVGGAVRDHLKGKTPRNYDLVTDATPSEIRMILDQSEEDFSEVMPKDEVMSSYKKYRNLPESNGRKVFYASRWDSEGKEIEFTVVINGESFRLSPLSKSSKSRNIDLEKSEMASTVEDDSQNRDFTINSLYIPLNNADGDNNDLMDPHGGAHHLKNGQIIPINNKFKDRLSEDPSTALRYLNYSNRFSNNESDPDNEKSILNMDKNYEIPKDVAKKEFVDTIEHPDCNFKNYIKKAVDTRVIDKIFPGIQINPEDIMNIPTNLTGDRWFVVAWLFRNNDPEDVKNMLLENGWTKNEANDIAHLIKIHNWGKSNYSSGRFYDMKNAHCGLTKGKMRDWMKISGIYSPAGENFLTQDDNDLKTFVGQEVNPVFTSYLGRTPQEYEIEPIRRHLSTIRWLDSF
jgi:tRNA nucleotidyltransferase/poly(A) polymerase